jgi:hypothetical protein
MSRSYTLPPSAFLACSGTALALAYVKEMGIRFIRTCLVRALELEDNLKLKKVTPDADTLLKT